MIYLALTVLSAIFLIYIALVVINIGLHALCFCAENIAMVLMFVAGLYLAAHLGII